MSLEEFSTILEGAEIPVAYHAFAEEQKPPYICYNEVGSNNFMADGKVYLKVKQLYVELYTVYRDPEMEERIENILEEIPWQKTISFLNDEGVYETIYEVEV